jgi:hypothetical protein
MVCMCNVAVNTYSRWGASISQTGTGWSAVLINIRNGLSVASFSAPGFWGDGSLMLTPGMGKGAENLMSNARFRTQFTAWSVLGFNILLVGNLSKLEPFVLDTWSNAEVIAVNQVGSHARRPQFALPPTEQPADAAGITNRVGGGMGGLGSTGQARRRSRRGCRAPRQRPPLHVCQGPRVRR